MCWIMQHGPIPKQAFLNRALCVQRHVDVAVIAGDATVGSRDFPRGTFEVLQIDIVTAHKCAGHAVAFIASTRINKNTVEGR